MRSKRHIFCSYFGPFMPKLSFKLVIRSSLQNSPLNTYFKFILLNKDISIYVFSVLRYLVKHNSKFLFFLNAFEF